LSLSIRFAALNRCNRCSTTTKERTMLLKGKTAVVFAATGAIGAAVAARFAAEGARVFISGRDKAALQRLGNQLDAPWEQVDASDEQQVTRHLEQVERNAGVDVVFNAIGLRAADADYATPSTTLPFERFLRPLQVIAGSQFLTACAAARHMLPEQRGSRKSASASSQETRSREPSWRRRIGCRSRVEWSATSRNRVPLAHTKPWLIGCSRSARIRVSAPRESASMRKPQCASQILQNVFCGRGSPSNLRIVN